MLDNAIVKPDVCRTSRRIARFVFTGMCFLTIVRAHPCVFPARISIYWADMAMTVIAGCYVLGVRHVRCSFDKGIAVSLLLLLTILSTTGLVSLLLVQIDPVDFVVSVLRVCYYGLMLVAITDMHQKAKWKADSVIQLLDICFVANFTIALFQLIQPPIVGDLVLYIFGTEKLRSIWTGYPRVYGAFANANWFGAYLAFCGTAWTALYLSGARRLSWYIGRMGVLLAVSLVTASRSSVLSLALGILVMIIYYGKTWKIVMVAALAFIARPFLSWVSQRVPLMEKTLSRLVILTPTDNDITLVMDSAFQGRMLWWQAAWDAFVEKPVFGYGSNELSINLIPHNSYLTLLLTFGLIGTSAIIAWVFYLLLKLCRRKSVAGDAGVLKGWLVGFSASLALGFMSADFFNTTQVMLLWILLSAMCISVLTEKWGGPPC